MDTRKEIVSGFYDQIDEDTRLQRTRHGQLEYFTTMAYILTAYFFAFFKRNGIIHIFRVK